jgi:molybdopterin molybdotransferase
MAQFLKVKTAQEVLSMLHEIRPLKAEAVSLADACGRVLAADIQASEPVPPFNRATMDGYAVRSGDTFGASESLPALLEIAGEVLMGESPKVVVAPEKAVAIPTGGMLPEGADAVVMVEYTSTLDETTIEVTRPVAPGDNILKIGDDIADGEIIFKKGWRLRPQDIGMLAALGITEISVFKRPRVAVISTGDEIVPVESRAVPQGKVRDINTFSLAAQIESAGAEVGMREMVADNLDELISVCRKALEDHDMIVLSGGSSVGVRDFTLQVLDALPDPELLVHGIAIRPGKPAILGRAGGKIFWGLPGQPVSALIICQVFVVPALRRLQGLSETGFSGMRGRNRRVILNRRLPSVHGRTDYIPVNLSEHEKGGLEATPIFGKSGAISILSRADGYVIVPAHVEGFDQGAELDFFPFSY